MYNIEDGCLHLHCFETLKLYIAVKLSDRVKGVIWHARACDLKMGTATHWLIDATVTWPKSVKDLIMYSLFLRQIQHAESMERQWTHFLTYA